MTIKCGCGVDGCKIAVEWTDGNLLLTDKNGQQHLMNMDANGLVELVQGANKALVSKLHMEKLPHA